MSIDKKSILFTPDIFRKFAKYYLEFLEEQK